MLEWYQKHTQVTHAVAVVGLGLVAAYNGYPPFHDLVQQVYGHVPVWGKTLIATAGWLYTWYRSGVKA
jgi:hypothetical protein